MIFGTLICRFRGHQRGKLSHVIPLDNGKFEHIYVCPRCDRKKSRIKTKGKLA